GSWLALTVGWLLVGPEGPTPHTPLSFGSLLHLLDSLLGGLLWLATRGVRRQTDVLHKLDVGATLGLVVVWVSLAFVIPDLTIGSYVALLAFLTGTVARAIVVPSTAARTLFIGLAGGLFLVGIAAWRVASGQIPVIAAIALACWTASGVVLCTIASHTIFGLRREAQQARVFGQYTLDTKIGEGGMGVVWRASHALLRRPTAVKLVAPRHIGDHAIRRFEREVQLTARLTHPNSVAIYDYGRARDGTFYYAMEYLDGIDLERLVGEHGPQPPGRVVHVLSQICGALAEAHDLGLVHRDVKPANVLLAPRSGEHEVAKIVDFGLAKSIELEPASGAASATNKLTGTPLYMSPEAIQTPESVDGRSDIYGLGAVAWFLLVGRPPFEGKSVIEICARHLHEPPLPPHVALGRPLPTDLEDIVLACLEKSADARPHDARALRERLEACSANKEWSRAEATEFWRARADSTPPDSPHQPPERSTTPTPLELRG
ncbi:MAG TPA: serine/threonine-protein kinase, partial [Polyangiaceae bacterium]|nr:serine/threonine-protein kinase [Polyangiaceae bacterium]